MKSLAIYCTTEEDQDVLERVELVDSHKKPIKEDDLTMGEGREFFFEIRTNRLARAKELIEAGEELRREVERDEKVRRLAEKK